MANLKKIFSKIYDQYIDKIYRFVFFKVNSKDIAEDLTSEIFLRVWKRFKNQEQKIENIQAFLYKTARNLITDYYREKGKVRIVSAENPGITDPRENLEEKAILASDIEKVREALSTLKDDYQNVIIWYYLDDLSISEISDLLGRTETATRVLIHRALKSLKNKLES